jgi:hypothetical protein
LIELCFMGMKRKKKLIYYKVHLLDCKLSLDMQTIFSCLGHVRFLGVQIEKQKIFGAWFDLMGQHLKVTWIRPAKCEIFSSHPPWLFPPPGFSFLPLLLNFGTRFTKFFCLEDEIRNVFSEVFDEFEVEKLR